MSNYQRGVRLERDVRHDLEANGYEVIRSAGSKSAIDLVAFKPGELLFVQCKAASGAVSPDERCRQVRLWSVDLELGWMAAQIADDVLAARKAKPITAIP
ncbi:MAG: hypothetical protein MUF60_09500 [Vicinamibacterales bacterium]|nr:hypothetical protein [Vicinamibacterales bacterium]